MANDIEVQTSTIARTESVDEKVIASKDVDEALQFLHANAATAHLTEIDEKRLMRKVDWMIMPLMFSVYYLQYTDKTLRTFACLLLGHHCTSNLSNSRVRRGDGRY
jgi:hypothetical protein